MPETPVSHAFEEIKVLLADGIPDEGSVEYGDFLHRIHNQLAWTWSQTQRETRAEIADELDRLGEGRLEYVPAAMRNPEHAGDIEAMGGTTGMIYGEATGARWLAKIIRGDVDDRGWLPSWRWSK